MTDIRLQDKLLKKAEDFLESFDYEKALQTTYNLIENYQEDVKVLELHSSILLELALDEEAKKFLLRAVEISPKEGYSKFFSLAQLYEGQESVNLYKKGIEILHHKLQQNSEDIALLQMEFSNACCAIAEEYMTDLCNEENAEQECKRYIDLSIEMCEINPDAYTCLARFNIFKEEFEIAKQALEKSLSLWFPQYKAASEGEGNEEDIELPSNQSRFNLAKCLIETEMYQESEDVLESLLKEDDKDPEVWYLLGSTSYMRGKVFYVDCRYYLKHLLLLEDTPEELLEDAKVMLQEIGDDEEDMEDTGEVNDSDFETDEEDVAM